MVEDVPVRTVYLLRHAKSSWDDPGLADEDRPLAPRGRKAAALIGEHLRAAGAAPDQVLCSSALRARQTLDLVLPYLAGAAPVSIEDELYAAGGASLAGRLRRLPDEARSVLLVGHNPGIQQLALSLAATSSGGPGTGAGELAALEEKYPTAGLAVIALPDGPWSGTGGGRLVEFVRPRRRG